MMTIHVVQQGNDVCSCLVAALRRATSVQRPRRCSLDAVIRRVRCQAAVRHQLGDGEVAAGRGRRPRRRRCGAVRRLVVQRVWASDSV